MLTNSNLHVKVERITLKFKKTLGFYWVYIVINNYVSNEQSNMWLTVLCNYLLDIHYVLLANGKLHICAVWSRRV